MLKMLNDDLDISQSLSIELPLIPPRSILYSIPPIGIGTGDVEGLTSYICRLAEAHCVSPTNLLRYQIEPVAGNGRVKATKSVNLQSHPSGDNRVAVRYVQALEYLTMQPNLSELTLSSWLMGKRPIGNILTSLFVDRPISMLKTCREWCPDCLQEWQNSDRDIYEPLLWSLSLVAICPHHDRWLERCCPHCANTQPIFAAKTRVGHCSHCHAWLGMSSDYSKQEGDRCEDRKVWLSWLAHQAFAVISAPNHRPTELIQQGIKDYLKGAGKENINAHWWQKYSADVPDDRVSDDDRLTLLKILAREIPI
jgi:TniQ